MENNVSSVFAQFDFSDAVDYHRGAFPPGNLDLVRLLEPISDARAALAAYAQMLEGLPNPDLLLAPLRGQEAVASSRMEGTFSTLEDVMRLQSQLDGNKDQKVDENSAYEVFLYSTAIRQAQTALDAGATVNEMLIRNAHQTLLRFGRGMSKDPGRYKTEQNYIGDERRKTIEFIPIAPLDLPAAMQDLVEFMSDETVNKLVRIAVSHAEFEALHPFKDGNGRVGRMIISLLLSSYDLLPKPYFYLSGYFDRHKDAYVSALRRVSSHQDWLGWCLFFFQAIKEQAEETLDVANTIAAHYADMKPVFADCLGFRWSYAVIDYVFANPSFITAPRLARAIGVERYNANRFINQLHKNSLIFMYTPASGRRPAVYIFPSLLNIVRR